MKQNNFLKNQNWTKRIKVFFMPELNGKIGKSLRGVRFVCISMYMWIIKSGGKQAYQLCEPVVACLQEDKMCINHSCIILAVQTLLQKRGRFWLKNRKEEGKKYTQPFSLSFRKKVWVKTREKKWEGKRR